MWVGVLKLTKRAVALEGLDQLGDALSSVNAITIWVEPAECVFGQAAAREYAKSEHCQRLLTLGQKTST